MFRTGPSFESRLESKLESRLESRLDPDIGAGFRFRLRFRACTVCATPAEFELRIVGFVADAVRLREQLPAEEQLKLESATPKWVESGSTQPARQTAIVQRKAGCPTSARRWQMWDSHRGSPSPQFWVRARLHSVVPKKPRYSRTVPARDFPCLRTPENPTLETGESPVHPLAHSGECTELFLLRPAKATANIAL
jgi:hypothetical protein